MLLSWSALEALNRILLHSDQYKSPLRPNSVVEALATHGYIGQDDASKLRTLVQKRNEFIHGGLQTKVSENEIDYFKLLLYSLLQKAYEKEQQKI